MALYKAINEHTSYLGSFACYKIFFQSLIQCPHNYLLRVPVSGCYNNDNDFDDHPHKFLCNGFATLPTSCNLHVL